MQPSSRQDELASLRLRLVAEPEPCAVDCRERELAHELLHMREQMKRLIDPVQACRTCGKGFPLPNGRWDGGYCCGGATENVFSQTELAVLRAAGTRPSDFRTREFKQAGCVFRGPNGCLLPPAHRPNLCCRYACRLLSDEYEQRGITRETKQLASKILRTFHEFSSLRDQRIEREHAHAIDRVFAQDAEKKRRG